MLTIDMFLYFNSYFLSLEYILACKHCARVLHFICMNDGLTSYCIFDSYLSSMNDGLTGYCIFHSYLSSMNDWLAKMFVLLEATLFACLGQLHFSKLHLATMFFVNAMGFCLQKLLCNAHSTLFRRCDNCWMMGSCSTWSLDCML
jgi:hypothetical protein